MRLLGHDAPLGGPVSAETYDPTAAWGFERAFFAELPNRTPNQRFDSLGSSKEIPVASGLSAASKTGDHFGDREVVRSYDFRRQARSSIESFNQRKSVVAGLRGAADLPSSRVNEDIYQTPLRPHQQSSFELNPPPADSTTRVLSGPSKFLQSLLKLWKLTDRDALLLLGYEGDAAGILEEFLLTPVSKWSRDQKERMADLIEIRTILDALLRDIDAENEWLRQSREDLDGQSPLDLMLSGSMENLIAVKYFVQAIAGR